MKIMFKGNPSNEEASSKTQQQNVKMVTFSSSMNKGENISQEVSDDMSVGEDFIVAYQESEDTLESTVEEKKTVPKRSSYQRSAPSRPAPGTVKKMMARFQHSNQ